MKKHIPNTITLGNLLSGTIGAIAAVNGNFEIAALSVAIGVVLDFFDGFFARMLNVSGELGKELDSLSRYGYKWCGTRYCDVKIVTRKRIKFI